MIEMPMLGGIGGTVHQPTHENVMNSVMQSMMMFKPSESPQYNDYLSSPQFNIKGLFLQETGTYNTQFARPYHAELSSANVRSLGNRVDEITNGNPAAKIHPELISGLCSGIIAPSATHEGVVNIVNGWNERRFRFILVVEIPNAFACDIYIFQGYSEFYDVSMISGKADPNMVFFINSEIRLQRAKAENNFGFSDRIKENKQFINGTILSDHGNIPLNMMRPKDVISKIQSNSLNDAYGNVAFFETRTNGANRTHTNTRQNDIPSRYLARTIGNYRTAQALDSYGEGRENVYDRAIQSLHEQNPYENPFIRRLSDASGFGTSGKTTFTLNELSTIDPMIGAKVSYSPVANNSPMSIAGTASMDMNGSNIETILACMISNGLAGLMIEAGLAQVSFVTTTMTPNGAVDTRMLAPGVTMTTAVAQMAYQQFITLFNTTMMPDLSRNFMIPFAATVNADLFGDIEVYIQIEGRQPERAVFPAFADALMPTTVTRSETSFDSLAGGILDLMNVCGLQNISDDLTSLNFAEPL